MIALENWLGNRTSTLPHFSVTRRRKQSQGRENTIGAGENARSQCTKALYQSIHLGRQRQKLISRRGNERGSRVQVTRRQKSRANGSKVGGGRASARSFHG